MYEGDSEYLHAFGYQKDGAAACQFDMGGPLVAGYTIVGIISWDQNKTCSYSSRLPTSALRVQSNIGWIQNIIFNSIL